MATVEEQPFELRYDHIVRFNLTDEQCTSIVANTPKDLLAQCGCTASVKGNRKTPVRQRCINLMVELLRYALRNRIVEVAVQEVPVESSTICIGIAVNEETFTRAVERGPSGDEMSAVAQFRRLWGEEKTHLRKFADAQIRETIAFEAKTAAEKRLIVERMVRHLLQLHFGITELRYDGGERLERILQRLRPPPILKERHLDPGEYVRERCALAYDTVSKALRNLDDVPLKIINVQHASAIVRGTETPHYAAYTTRRRAYDAAMNVHATIEEACDEKDAHLHKRKLPNIEEDAEQQSYCPSIPVYITFEHSNAWPNDLQAHRRLQAAMYVQIAALLRAKFKLNALATRTSIDLMLDTFVFRIEIVSERALRLLADVDRDRAQQLVNEQIVRVKVGALLQSLSVNHPTYGLACQAVKHWRDTNLLSNHLNNDLVELTVAYLYAHPTPYTAPRCSVRAFHRWLRLMHTHDWTSEPLIVDPNADLKAADCKQLRMYFEKQRLTLPPMVVIHPFDRTGASHSRLHPQAPVLDRIMKLAKRADSLLTRKLIESQVQSLFTADTSIFDIVINLNEAALTRRPQLNKNLTPRAIMKKGRKRLMKQSEEQQHALPVIDIDPLSDYVQQITCAHDAELVFFADLSGTHPFVGGMWRPSVRDCNAIDVDDLEQAETKAKRVKLNQKGVAAVIATNVEAVVDDLYLLGGRLVVSVDVRKAPFKK